VNADEIARGLSPFQPEKVAIEAGRIMLNRIVELLGKGESFAFETTLSTRSYRQKVEDAKNRGFTITLLFFWLQDSGLAKERVKIRVSEGGHSIDDVVIERRYKQEIKNLIDIYLPIVNAALIFDNSFGKHTLFAKKIIGQEIDIIDDAKFKLLKRCYDKS
jgi:predicted ABC-type ATPase